MSSELEGSAIWAALQEHVQKTASSDTPLSLESFPVSARITERIRKIEQEARAARQAQENEPALLKRQADYAAREQAHVAARLALPIIPTRVEADRAGCRMPAVHDFQWRAGTWMVDLDGIELPEVPDEKIMEAYNLLPAFMYEYGEKYRRHGLSVRPSFVLKMWIQVLSPSEEAIRKNRVLWPHELRFVVEEMANPQDGSNPQMFNPANMVAVAGRLRSENGEAFDRAIAEYYGRSSYEYNFHKTVSPARDALNKGLATPVDWCRLALYPQAFPDDVVSADTQLLINQIIQYRYTREVDQGFTSIAARFVTETMLQAIGYQNRRNLEVSFEKTLDLAYRFSVPYIQSVRPHDVSTFKKKPIPKFVPPED